MLWTNTEALSDGAQLRADVFPHDVSGAGGRREEARQNRPESIAWKKAAAYGQ